MTGVFTDSLRAAPAAVLWDLDGTIIDSEPLWLNTEQQMLARYGLKLTDEIVEKMVGIDLRDGAQLFQRLGVPLTVSEIIGEWVTGVNEQLLRGEAAWRPGARELLAEVRAAGVKNALVTMSTFAIAQRVADLLPAGTFDTVVAGDHVTRGKPHPDAYLLAAEQLGVSAADCLAFEDSRTGLTAASAAGAVSVGVKHLQELHDVPAHAVIPSLLGFGYADPQGGSVLSVFAANYKREPHPGGYCEV